MRDHTVVKSSAPASGRISTAGLILLALVLAACGAPEESSSTPLLSLISIGGSNPHRLDFGAAVIGAEPGTATIGLRNDGPSAVAVQIAVSSPPFQHEGPAVVAIAPGAMERVTFAFVPTSPGSFHGTVDFQILDGGALQTELAGRGVAAEFSCTAAVDFGLQAAGMHIEREVECTNATELPITVRTHRLTGPNSTDFEVIGAEERIIAAGHALQIPVRFGASSPGVRTATLEVTVIGNQSRATVALSGEIVRETIEVSPTCDEGGLDFGLVAPGEIVRRPVTLRNRVPVPITIEQASLLGADKEHFRLLTEAPYVLGVDNPATEAREDELEVQVEFAPTEFGDRLATIAFDVESPAHSLQTCVRGQSGQAELACDPPSIDFGTVVVGMPRTEAIRCTNVGDNLLYVIDTDPRSAEVALAIVNDNGSHGASSLGYAPGQGFDLQVTWAPAVEAPLDAIVDLHTNAREPRTSVSIVGDGVALPPCEIEVLPQDLHFGIVAPGRQVHQDLRLRNGQAHACVVRDLHLASGAEAFEVDPIAEQVLAPAEELRVPVRFAPPAEAGEGERKTFSGTLLFEASDPASPERSVSLQGIAGQTCLELSPAHLDFGAVAPGCQSRERSIDLINACAEEITIEALSLSAATCPDTEAPCAFQVDPLVSQTIRPGERVTLRAAFQPEDLGEQHGVLLVHLAGEGEAIPVSLQAYAGVAPIQTDRFTMSQRTKVDVLWVIDDSASLDFAHMGVGDNLGAFLAFADQWGIDFQMGITTTDVTASGPNGRLVPLPPTTSPRILSNYTPDLESHFAANVRVGSTGSSSEQGLEGARRALELRNVADDPQTPLPGDGNLGLFRDGAALSIIFVADEPDQSPLSVDAYLDEMLAYKPAGMLKMHGIIPDLVTGCSGGVGTSERYGAAIAATGGHWDSICTHDWEGTLQQLGNHAFGFPGVRGSFELTSQPACDGACDDLGDPPAIQVLVDGYATPSRSNDQQIWSYAAARNSIEFLPDYAPPPGAEVEITYQVQCIAPEEG